MDMRYYEDVNAIGLDVIREVGSIGTGNAATAISQLLGAQVRITLPDVRVLGFNEAVHSLGHPEEQVAAILVEMSKDMEGMMLFLMKMDFIQSVLHDMLGMEVSTFAQLDELAISALTEVGNIMISSYVNSLSGLAGMDIQLSVPALSINMLGAVLSTPIIEFGYETNQIMMVTGKFILNDQPLESSLLLLPHLQSLENLIQKLVTVNE
jgi:chemotaxis protein CheC